MCQTLSEPVTTKHTESYQNMQFLKVGSSSMQGWRINMEDSHTQILELPDDPSAAFFGVYDGHGGNNYFKRISTTNSSVVCQNDSCTGF
ncbi:probable protein phosphatase 2C T23F11.1 [Acyrthosiphon pisum]|uniref:PPM-type phosphatase domain-containing protein n=1 Tax=Acyrthosiphon pisum TaxID=7029 RepID=A0A8R2BBC8_ACYPI|nr:probable protein phosphatase 2C T23F11.1 [Acyrthosiphon pisum]|eukprot:XP_008189566.2 PREDICTED: probable protein phosphatase 2C T23F11.1 [Acyrthosiphon pisum]